MSGAIAVGRGVALFARSGAARARGAVAVSAARPPVAPAAPASSSAPRGRSLVIAHGKKKGFAELLGDLAAPKDAGDFQGRPRLTKGKVTAKQHVPPHIAKPPYADSGFLPDMRDDPQIHNAEQIEKMRKAGRLAAEVLDYAESLATPGVTTDFIDQKVHKMIVDAGAYPSPLNYGGFPKSVCTSLNECICHGIPDDTVLLDGDIINIDVTVFLDGHHGDTSRTVLVGNVSDEVRALVKATDDSLKAAIDVCGPGVPIRKIGATIHALADERGYGVVEKFVGHGVGREFHSGPTVRHHRNNDAGSLVLGQTFTIEPMLTIGKTNDKMWRDGWTAVTADGKWTAQCEHTLLVVEGGVEILTASPKGLWGPLEAVE
jgi:methionyl aminopeptidase